MLWKYIHEIYHWFFLIGQRPSYISSSTGLYETLLVTNEMNILWNWSYQEFVFDISPNYYFLFDDCTKSGFSFTSVCRSLLIPVLRPRTLIRFAGTKPVRYLTSPVNESSIDDEKEEEDANNQPLSPCGWRCFGAKRKLCPLIILSSASSLASKSWIASAT